MTWKELVLGLWVWLGVQRITPLVSVVAPAAIARRAAPAVKRRSVQPPVRDRRILALDPGYKSGCKLVALDQFGSLLDHGVFYLIGKPERRQEARAIVAQMVEEHQLTVIAIGNGTACRHTEDFFGEVLGAELKDKGTSYVIVNEAGASVYSTSRMGREEFPQFDASVRGAVSIGRRLQDPLSELVKIDPANLGVGLYQHDVKANHLRESLDEVVLSGGDPLVLPDPQLAGLVRRLAAIPHLKRFRIHTRMPVVIPETLPAKETLNNENIFVMGEDRARQRVSPAGRPAGGNGRQVPDPVRH